MPLPEFVPSVSPEMRQAIDAALRDIETGEIVRSLFAIESGSRAWGFPSPDSDYGVETAPEARSGAAGMAVEPHPLSLQRSRLRTT